MHIGGLGSIPISGLTIVTNKNLLKGSTTIKNATRIFRNIAVNGNRRRSNR